MSTKCAICHKAFVNNPGDICFSCQLKQPRAEQAAPSNSMPDYLGDPEYTQPKKIVPPTIPQPTQKQPLPNYEPYTESNKEKDYSGSEGSYSGIVQNLMVNDLRGETMNRWFRSLFYGVPFSVGKKQYVFSIFSQNAYAGANVSGHSVMFYGNSDYSFLSNNTPVTVYGTKMSDGVILANRIEGTNYGFSMKSRFSLTPAMVRLFTLLAVLLVVLCGALMTRSVSEHATENPSGTTAVSRDASGGYSDLILRPTSNSQQGGLGILLIIAGTVCLFKKFLLSRKAAIALCVIGAGLLYPMIMVLMIVVILIKFFMKIK